MASTMRIYVETSEATYNAKRFKLNTICITKSTIANLRTFIENTDFESFIGSVGSAAAHMDINVKKYDRRSKFCKYI